MFIFFDLSYHPFSKLSLAVLSMLRTASMKAGVRQPVDPIISPQDLQLGMNPPIRDLSST